MCIFFFFQAEDGIRDLVRSRGLGDVYKRQIYDTVPTSVDPKIFAGVENPGAEALKISVGYALGLDVDYYALVDMDGFVNFIDALGGITVNIKAGQGSVILRGTGAQALHDLRMEVLQDGSRLRLPKGEEQHRGAARGLKFSGHDRHGISKSRARAFP
mgnify:CR=1 FL=1